MEEADHPGESRAGGLVDELDARRGRCVQVGGAVVGFEADVVQALAAAFKEAGDAGVVAHGLEQLDLGVPAGEKDAADALVLDDAVHAHGEAEGVAIEAERIAGAADDDANVMDLAEHGAPSSCCRRRAWLRARPTCRRDRRR